MLAFLYALCDSEKGFMLIHDTHLYLFTVYAVAYAAEELELRELKKALFDSDKVLKSTKLTKDNLTFLP